MSHGRGDMTDKWHRVCAGCGSPFHVRAVRDMDGNECCPGEKFTRDMAEVDA